MTGPQAGHCGPHQPRGEVPAEGPQQHQQSEFSWGIPRGWSVDSTTCICSQAHCYHSSVGDQLSQGGKILPSSSCSRRKKVV